VVNPSSTAPTSRATTALANSTRRLKIHSGSTGSAARRCTAMKIAINTAPEARTRTLVTEFQAQA